MTNEGGWKEIITGEAVISYRRIFGGLIIKWSEFAIR